MRCSTKLSTRSSTTANTGHGGGGKSLLDTRNRKVALLIAVIALCLAFSETLGKSAQTAALSYNVEASNLWAFFQAKTIRQTVLQAATEILKLDLAREGGDPAATKAALAKRIQSWEAIAARYDTELMDPPVRKEVNLNPPYGEGRRELMARAIAAEKRKRDTRWRNTTTTRWHRPRSRSGSCWRPRPSSPAWWC